MPKRRGLKGVGLVPQQIEEIIRPVAAPLTVEERSELRAVLSTPLMKKVWANARSRRPSPHVDRTALDAPTGSIVANNRLHEMRGWEAFEAAILIQIMDPKPVRAPVRDSYPDAGLPMVEKK